MILIAEAIGALLGAMIKKLGAAGVEALVRGLRNALIDKQVVSKNNAEIQDEFNRIPHHSIDDEFRMRNNGNRASE
jgi:hypothetical protein